MNNVISQQILSVGQAISESNAARLKESALEILKVLLDADKITRQEINDFFVGTDIQASLSKEFAYKKWKSHFCSTIKLFCQHFNKNTRSTSLVNDLIEQLQVSKNEFSTIGQPDGYWGDLYDGIHYGNSYTYWDEEASGATSFNTLTFSEQVALKSESDLLRTLMSLFVEKVSCAVYDSDQTFSDRHGDRTREEIFEEAIVDLQKILLDMAEEESSIAAASKKEDGVKVKAEPIPITCSVFDLSRGNPTTAHPNILRVNGIVCTADRVTDQPPGAGTNGLPLLIEASAASKAIERLEGFPMPLNLNIELDDHDKRSVRGAMSSLEVNQDNSVQASGCLWPENFKDLTDILSSKSDLGMSIEATPIDYEIKEIDGRQVYCLKEFDITGATVLQRKKAADQSSSFNIAASTESSTTEAIAASSQENNQGETTMPQENKIDAIAASIEQIGESLKNIAGKQEEFDSKLDEVYQDYTSRQEAIKASATAEALAQEQEKRTKEITEIVTASIVANNEQVILPAFQQQLEAIRNPLGVPPRKTSPTYDNPQSISASGNNSLEEKRRRLGYLEGLDHANRQAQGYVVNADSLALSRQIADLQQELGVQN